MLSSVYWDRQYGEKKLIQKLIEMYGDRSPATFLIFLQKTFREMPQLLMALGRHYKKRSPDPFNLVKSACVMTMASCLMLRWKEDDDAYTIDAEIERLFSHVLDLCKAKGPKLGLHELHNDVIFDTIKTIPAISIVVVKKEFDEFRKHPSLQGVRTPEKMKQEKEVLEPIIKKLKGLAIILHGMVRNLSDIAIKIMGKPPIEYSILKTSPGGTTPYGDFEFAVIISNDYNKRNRQQKDKVMTYFRGVQLILQLLVTTVRGRVFPQLYLPTMADIDADDQKWYYDCITPCDAVCDPMSPFASKYPEGTLYRMKRKTKFALNHIDTVSNSATREAEIEKHPSYNLSHFAFASILEKAEKDADVRMFFDYFSNIFENDK